MADFQNYSDALVKIEGQLLTESSSVSVEKKSGLSPVYTTVGGFSGMAPGSPVMEVSIENAVPAVDFEMDFDSMIATRKIVTVQIIMANKITEFKAFVTDATYSHSVNEAGKLHLKLMGRLASFE